MPTVAVVQSSPTTGGRSQHRNGGEQYLEPSPKRSPNLDDRRHHGNETSTAPNHRPHSAGDVVRSSRFEVVSDRRSRPMDVDEAYEGSMINRPRSSAVPPSTTSRADGSRSSEGESVFPELKYSLPSGVSRSPLSNDRRGVSDYAQRNPRREDMYLSTSGSARDTDDPSSSNRGSNARYLPTVDAVFNRDVVQQPDDGRSVESARRYNVPVTSGDFASFVNKFGTDFRFLEAFAERSKSHPFSGISQSLTPDRKRKLANYNRHEDERRPNLNKYESNRKDFEKPEMDFSAVAAAASAAVCQSDSRSAASDWYATSSKARDHEEVDPMSALLRRYGASSELLSMASTSSSARGSHLFPMTSSSVFVPTSSPRRFVDAPPPVPVPPPPSSATSFRSRSTVDQRHGLDISDSMMQTQGIPQHHRHQQPGAATVDVVDDGTSRSGHDNNFGGETGCESIISGSGSSSVIDESKGLSRDRDDVTDEGGLKNYYCHMCSYVGTSHSEYLSHTTSHFRHRCHLCDYMSTTAGRLKRHLQECHVVATVGGKTSEPEVTAEIPTPLAASGSSPSTSSFTVTTATTENRLKKCRKCEFQTTDQNAFYEHARTHIRPDRIIECPMCRFATQYRHHLELHLRNHLGSKPHQCPNCDYCCPVASMLASHMKSHSRVNRYRCAECSFSTKFSNALKRHLLAKDHEYGIVLNDDGSLPPEGPQRFYPNSASARRRRGAASGGTSNRSSGKSPGSAGNVGAHSEEATTPSTPQRTHISTDSGGSVKDADASAYEGSMTSPETVRPSVIVKLEEGRLDEEQVTRIEQIETSAMSARPLPVSIRAMETDQKSSPPRRYHADETGISMAFGVERLRCLVCGYPANGVADMTNHLMTSHGLASGTGSGIGDQIFQTPSLESPPKRPRLDAMRSRNPDYRLAGYGVAEQRHDETNSSSSRFAAEINRQLEVDMSREFIQRRQRHQQEHQQHMLAMWSGMTGRDQTINRFPFVDSFEPTSMNLIRSFNDESFPVTSLDRYSDAEPRGIPVDEMTTPYEGRQIRTMSSVAPPPPLRYSSPEVRATGSAPTTGPLDLSSKPISTSVSERGIAGEVSAKHAASLLESTSAAPRNPSQLDAFDEKYPSSSSSSSPATAKKSRRKGRAFKLDPSLLLNDSVEEPLADEFALGTTSDKTNEELHDVRESRGQMTSQVPENAPSQRMNPPKKNPALRPVSGGDVVNSRSAHGDALPKSLNPNDGEDNASATTHLERRSSTGSGNATSSMTELFECPYCGLGFRDKTLHAMHMEFHDRRPGSDPFRCNLCGQQTADQLEFFVHIARAPHSTTKMTPTPPATPMGPHSVTGAPSPAVLGRLVPAMS